MFLPGEAFRLAAMLIRTVPSWVFYEMAAGWVSGVYPSRGLAVSDALTRSSSKPELLSALKAVTDMVSTESAAATAKGELLAVCASLGGPDYPPTLTRTPRADASVSGQRKIDQVDSPLLRPAREELRSLHPGSNVLPDLRPGTLSTLLEPRPKLFKRQQGIMLRKN